MAKRGASVHDARRQLVHCKPFVAIALRVIENAQGENWREAKKLMLNRLAVAETISTAVFDDPKTLRVVKKLLGGINIRTWKDLRNALKENAPGANNSWLSICYTNLKKPAMAYQSAMDNEQEGRGLGALPLSERNELKRELIEFKKTGGW